MVCDRAKSAVPLQRRDYLSNGPKPPSVPAHRKGLRRRCAAATRAIAGAAYVLDTRALTDFVTVAVAIAAFIVLSKWKMSELWLIGAGAIVGLVIGDL
jgi:chromate transport protein ChrA